MDGLAGINFSLLTMFAYGERTGGARGVQYTVFRIIMFNPLSTLRLTMNVSTASKREVVQISSYSRRLRDNVKSILDNYGEILKASKVFMQQEPNN